MDGVHKHLDDIEAAVRRLRIRLDYDNQQGPAEIEELLGRLCGYNRTTEVWLALMKGGGAYRFTEIQRFTGLSSSTLTDALHRLLTDDLVRILDGKYQALVPEALR